MKKGKVDSSTKAPNEETIVRWPSQKTYAQRTIRDWNCWDFLTQKELREALSQISKCKTDIEIVKVLQYYRELVYSRDIDEKICL